MSKKSKFYTSDTHLVEILDQYKESFQHVKDP